MTQQIGEWDGITAQLPLSTPYARANQPYANGAWRSYFLQPWRGYMDTWPASRLKNGFGINFNSASKYYDAVAQMLKAAGCSTLRVELGFGTISYTNPSQVVSTAPGNYGPLFQIALKYGMRPLITLNSNGQAPCPFTFITTQVAAGNIGDPTITITGSLTGLRAGYSGLNNQTFYQVACPMLTNINTGTGVCTLSQPLNKAFSAGNVLFSDLLYHPFSAESYSQSGNCTNGSAVVTGLAWPPIVGATATGTGVPANTTVLSVDSPTQCTLSANFTGTTGAVTLTFGNSFCDETIAGWMNYLTVISAFVASYVGNDGFDVEIWNELTFGSQYLNETNYYSPVRTVVASPSYTNYSITWPPAPFQGDVSYVLVARTTDFFKTNYPNVKVINGFSNTVNSYNPTQQFWPYMTGFSRHGYTASDFNKVPYDGAKGACAPGSGNAAPDNATIGPWKYDVNGYEGTPNGGNNVVSGSFFVPVFNLACPEAIGLGCNTLPCIMDIGAIPNPQGRYRGVTSPAPANQTAEWWQTEYNWDTTGFRTSLTAQGFSASDPRFIYLNQWIQAKALLRAMVFHIHKGYNKMVLYAVTNGDPLTFQVFPQAFFTALDASGNVLTPAAQSQLGPQMTTLQNLFRLFNGYSNPNSFPVSPVSVTYLVEYQPRLVVAGDGTSSNPTLTNADEYGIFPWQFDGDRYCISHYVVTRNCVHSYNQGVDALDTAKYTMPDQYFEIGLSFGANPGFRVDQARYVGSYDPLTDQWSEEQIISRDSQNIAVKVKSTDYPRFLYIGATVPPFPSKIFSGKSGKHGRKTHR